MKSWIRILPDGSFEHDASDSVQVFDETARREVLANFRPGVPVDFDHASLKAWQLPPAGSILELRNRGGELWGFCEWSEAGYKAVQGGRYKFLSPALESVPIEAGKYRPVRLKSVALTNRPQIPQLMILNMSNDFYLSGPNLPLMHNRGESLRIDGMDHRLELCAYLRLPTTASDAEIKQACLKRKVMGNRIGGWDPSNYGGSSWYLSNPDYKLELCAFLGIQSDASDAQINQLLGLKRDASPDYRQELLRRLKLPPGSTDDALIERLDDLQHNIKNMARSRLNNSNSERLQWEDRWVAGVPQLVRQEDPNEAARKNSFHRLANQLTKGKTLRQVMALAHQYQRGGHLRRALDRHVAQMKNSAGPGFVPVNTGLSSSAGTSLSSQPGSWVGSSMPDRPGDVIGSSPWANNKRR